MFVVCFLEEASSSSLKLVFVIYIGEIKCKERNNSLSKSHFDQQQQQNKLRKIAIYVLF